MALTLNQLLAAPSVDDWRTALLNGLKGLGIVVATGPGAGSVQVGSGGISLSGNPTGTYTKILIQITTDGELGTAIFQYSLDGGTTFFTGITVPSTTGLYPVSPTGVSVTFQSGIVGGTTSFKTGDTYSFAIQTPTLAVTAWISSGAYRQLVEVEAQALAALSQQQVGLAAGGYTTEASGNWCDLIGNGFYNLPRLGVGVLAGITKGLVTFFDAQGVGPFTISIGQIWVASTGGLRYNNATGGTLPKNGTLVLTVAAESPGSIYNVGVNQIQTIVAGTLPGVTINNPDPGSGTWITSQGTDPESDSAYMLRCQQRWATLGSGSPTAAYQLWATLAEASAGHATTINKTLVQSDTVIGGQINIFLAGSAGGVTSQPIADVVTYITPRVALPATINVLSATNQVMTIGGTVHYYAAKTTSLAIQAAVSAALVAYIGSVPIGTDNVGSIKVYYTEIDAAIGSVLGGAGIVVRDIAGLLLNAGTIDIALTLGNVATLTNSLSFVGV